MTSQPRIDWLKGRQSGIGGSEIAAIILIMANMPQLKNALTAWVVVLVE